MRDGGLAPPAGYFESNSGRPREMDRGHSITSRSHAGIDFWSGNVGEDGF
jgi:hypothetical protein